MFTRIVHVYYTSAHLYVYTSIRLQASYSNSFRCIPFYSTILLGSFPFARSMSISMSNSSIKKGLFREESFREGLIKESQQKKKKKEKDSQSSHKRPMNPEFRQFR